LTSERGPMPNRRGHATSTTSRWPVCRRCSQAAVEQTNTVSAGSKRCHAARSAHGSSSSQAQQYRRRPRRRHDLPLSALRVSPAARASSRVNGRRRSSDGTRGAFVTSQACEQRWVRPTLLVNARLNANARVLSGRSARLYAKVPLRPVTSLRPARRRTGSPPRCPGGSCRSTGARSASGSRSRPVRYR
jgi:hypothetical protein